MNYQSLFQETSASFGTTVEARAKVWVNAAYQEWLNYRKWSYLETTSAAIPLVASQQSYVLLGTSPVVTDYNGMISVELEVTASGARVPLREFDPQDFIICTAHSRVIGVPAFWATLGGTAQATAAAILSGGNQALALWPIPIATAGNGVNVFCRYNRAVSETMLMSGTTDVPIIPAKDHFALISGALAIGYSTFGQESLADRERMKFMQRMEAAAVDDMSMRNRDIQRLQLVQQPWEYPIQSGKQAGQPAPRDPYPVAH